MQIVVEIIGLLVNFEYLLCANFVTSTALAIVPFLTFILMGLLDISLASFTPTSSHWEAKRL